MFPTFLGKIIQLSITPFALQTPKSSLSCQPKEEKLDHIKHQEKQTVSKFNKSQMIMKALQFLLSFSIFSFIFSYSSWLSLFLHSFNFYVSMFTFQLFNYTIDKKYIFLLCNGILVFLVRNSGLVGYSVSEIDVQDEFRKRSGDAQQSVSDLSEIKALAVEKEVGSIVTLENIVLGGEEGGNGFLVTEKESENGSLITDEEGENGLLATEEGAEAEEEEEEEEGNGLLSKEELNKKCDDFIKRMKEEIRIEAQQLIMV